MALAAAAAAAESQDNESRQSSDFWENVFGRNIRIGHGANSVVVGPTIANTALQYIAAGHSAACTICHIDEIYQFRFRQDTMDALLDDVWEYTDDPAPILGVCYNGQEIPLGILRRALNL